MLNSHDEKQSARCTKPTCTLDSVNAIWKQRNKTPFIL